MIRLAIPRLALARLAVARLAVARLAVVRLAVARLAVGRLAVARLAVARLAVVRLAVARLAVARLAVTRLAEARFAVARLAELFGMAGPARYWLPNYHGTKLCAALHHPHPPDRNSREIAVNLQNMLCNFGRTSPAGAKTVFRKDDLI
jgi:hypothetical protein